MKVSKEGEVASSFDLDDTLIRREKLTRAFGVAKAKVKPSHLPSLGINDIPVVNREVSDESLRGISEKISFTVHAKRQVSPYGRELIQEAKNQGADIYGNTGRSNKRAWVDMSEQTLERGKIAHLMEGTFYTPEVMKTAVSKAAGILELRKHYKVVDHYEDDPRTAVYLAILWPDMIIHLIEYGSTGLLYSLEELEQFPNIRREAYPNNKKNSFD